MTTALARRTGSGYVYVMENPSLPGCLKVGHTFRPPHHRARELSSTGLPTPFQVSHARFFWDAPRAERAFHKTMASRRVSRSREFFSLSVDEAKATLEGMLNQGRAVTAQDCPGQEWGYSLEGLEEQWDWAQQECLSHDPAERAKGWSRMYQLSSMGWAQGSWRLAEAMMRANPSDAMAERASWVLDAAATQGHPTARLRAAWLRSFHGEAYFSQWSQVAGQYMETWGQRDIFSWPEGMLDTLSVEQDLWKTLPQRQLPFLNAPLRDLAQSFDDVAHAHDLHARNRLVR